jgi:hypothetical protein
MPETLKARRVNRVLDQKKVDCSCSAREKEGLSLKLIFVSALDRSTGRGKMANRSCSLRPCSLRPC